MKPFGQAFAIAVVIALASFGTIYSVLKDAHMAEGVAALPLVACHHIAEMLERRETRQSVASGKKADIYTLKTFGLSWPLMAACGMLILFAFVHISSLVAGLLLIMLWPEGNATGLQSIDLTAVFTMSSYVLGGYSVGRWIGSRCATHGILAVLLAVGLGTLLSRAADLVLSADQYKQSYLGHEATTFFVLGQLGIAFAVFTASGLFGYWRGRRVRFSKYFNYLMGVLPADVRNIMIELASDEAQRAATIKHSSKG